LHVSWVGDSPVIDDAPYKMCSRCKETKLLTDFHRQPHRKDGRKGVCKSCMIVYSAKYYQENGERIRHKVAEYRVKNIDKIKQYFKKLHTKRPRRNLEWREKNPIKSAIQRKRFYAKYCESIKAKANEWRRTHLEQKAASNAAYRARKRSVVVEIVRRSKLADRDGSSCIWCGLETRFQNLTIDHLIPLSRKGEHSYQNCVLACQSCNSSKRSKFPLDFLLSC
jgi:5-methylcytosine-specific restriction endonuclease McrA